MPLLILSCYRRLLLPLRFFGFSVILEWAEPVVQAVAREGVKQYSTVTPVGCLHVQEATASLFSARQAMEGSSQVIFGNNRCQVNRNCHTVMEGISQGDGLMVINQAKQQPAVCCGS